MKRDEDTIEVPVPLFGMFLEVYLGDPKNIVKWVQETFDADISDLVDDTFDVDGLTIDLAQAGADGYIVVYLKDFRRKLKKDFIAAAGTLAHECLHATTAVLESRGVPFTPENEEVIAYTQESMIRSTLEKMRKRHADGR